MSVNSLLMQLQADLCGVPVCEYIDLMARFVSKIIMLMQ